MAVQFCVVCGRGSPRASWSQSGFVNGIAYVACDFHSQVAIATAVVDSGGIPSTVQAYPAQNGKNGRKQIPEQGQ